MILYKEDIHQIFPRLFLFISIHKYAHKVGLQD